jgi:plasmid stability protein
MNGMTKLTIRDVPAGVVRRLKTLAKRHNTSMAQEVRALLEEYTAGRTSVLEHIESSWEQQTRRPSAREIDAWINAGRK